MLEVEIFKPALYEAKEMNAARRDQPAIFFLAHAIESAKRLGKVPSSPEEWSYRESTYIPATQAGVVIEKDGDLNQPLGGAYVIEESPYRTLEELAEVIRR